MAFPWMAAATLGSAGISALGSMFGGEDKQGGGGVTPYQVISMPTYPWQSPTLETAADFTQKGLRNLTEGKVPEWWNKYQAPVRRGMERGVEQTFYGSGGLGGNRGIMDQVRATGAATGIGPKATVAGTNKALQSYADKRSQIEEYLAGKTLDFGQSQSEKLPWMAAQIGSISPPAQVVGGQPYNMPAQENPWLSAMGQITDAMPYMGDIFGDVGQATQDWGNPFGMPRQTAPVGQTWNEAAYNRQQPGYGMTYSNVIGDSNYRLPYDPGTPWEPVR